jgi:hypothetical protein
MPIFATDATRSGAHGTSGYEGVTASRRLARALRLSLHLRSNVIAETQWAVSLTRHDFVVVAGNPADRGN